MGVATAFEWATRANLAVVASGLTLPALHLVQPVHRASIFQCVALTTLDKVVYVALA